MLWIKSKAKIQIQGLFIPELKRENKIELVKGDLIDNSHRKDKNYLMENSQERMNQGKKIIQAFQEKEVIIEIKINLLIEDLIVNLEIIKNHFQMIVELITDSNLNLDVLENSEEIENENLFF